ncbi:MULTISPECIES: FxsA family protein [Helcobacillus]|uniref:UPF0716 protein FxsA n=1 Tax=Helcobacillus massiliensis TaxID=521392 RepID=A0A839QPJ9_9MICO|nr:FxsA family protein [Helcobacillus massiliensis]MBB3022423.1 UPF0716 protein FxsA [Helcobacillus massiliensis]MCG7426934.1 FxsA family protein [Helcobacillus sp. ACRRO]MDK7741128.1 FxsA family protein [Helcobacillus massiliensis]WOO93936.1 FxsA family protein [Helcobacillus massiliensis]
MKEKAMSLLPLWILLIGLAELAILIAIGVNTSFWWPVLIVVIGWLIGIALLVLATQQSMSRLGALIRTLRDGSRSSSRRSRPVFTLMAALLFFFPGILTDLAGLALLLTPVQDSAMKKAGLGSANRRQLFFRGRGGVIEGEIVVTSDDRASSTGSHAATQTPPPMIEGGVVREKGEDPRA